MILTSIGVIKLCAFIVKKQNFLFPSTPDLSALHKIFSRSTLRITSMESFSLESSIARWHFALDKNDFHQAKFSALVRLFEDKVAAINNKINALNSSFYSRLTCDWLLEVESKMTRCRSRTTLTFFPSSLAAHEHKKSLGQHGRRLNVHALQKCSLSFSAQTENAAQ